MSDSAWINRRQEEIMDRQLGRRLGLDYIDIFYLQGYPAYYRNRAGTPEESAGYVNEYLAQINAN